MGVWNDTLDAMQAAMGYYLNDRDPGMWLDFISTVQADPNEFLSILEGDVECTLTVDDIDPGMFPIHLDICQDGYIDITLSAGLLGVTWGYNNNTETSDVHLYGGDSFVGCLNTSLLTQEASIRALESSVADTVDITYNSNVIATMSGPGTKTLTCSGKIMASNVVLAKTGTDNTMTVSYGGNNIVNSSAAGTKTLNCNGKYMSTDVVVTLA